MIRETWLIQVLIYIYHENRTLMRSVLAYTRQNADDGSTWETWHFQGVMLIR